MSKATCIVGVAAHAADMEFSAGATLLKHATMDWDAHIIHLTLGEKGHARLSIEDYGRQKRAEAEDAGELVRPLWAGPSSVSQFVQYRAQ